MKEVMTAILSLGVIVTGNLCIASIGGWREGLEAGML
jgi:hypothetical protein